MPDVIIKGMKIPEDCPVCPMSHWNRLDEFTGCEIVGGKKFAMTTEPGYAETSARPDWCPLRPMPEWISVETPPENNKPVLCRAVDRTICGTMCRMVGAYHDGAWFLQNGPGTLSYPSRDWKVTHWMPLPDGPEEVQNA